MIGPDPLPEQMLIEVKNFCKFFMPFLTIIPSRHVLILSLVQEPDLPAREVPVICLDSTLDETEDEQEEVSVECLDDSEDATWELPDIIETDCSE